MSPKPPKTMGFPHLVSQKAGPNMLVPTTHTDTHRHTQTHRHRHTHAQFLSRRGLLGANPAEFVEHRVGLRCGGLPPPAADAGGAESPHGGLRRWKRGVGGGVSTNDCLFWECKKRTNGNPNAAPNLRPSAPRGYMGIGQQSDFHGLQSSKQACAKQLRTWHVKRLLLQILPTAQEENM